MRPTLIAAVAIPSSLIATFAAMAYMGFTLNVITLLTLAVGIVIDDAVVVLENIFRHMEEKNMTPAQAAVAGTKEVGLAVMATSMSLIVVFLPVAFMAGIVGRFMFSFGVTMAFAIAVSLLVSFTLTPMMASRYLANEVAHAALRPFLHARSRPGRDSEWSWKDGCIVRRSHLAPLRFGKVRIDCRAPRRSALECGGLPPLFVTCNGAATWLETESGGKPRALQSAAARSRPNDD